MSSSATLSSSASKGKSGFSQRPKDSSAPDLSGVLGNDGKLTPAEHKRWFDNHLYLFCGGSSHSAKECPCSTSCAVKTKAHAAKVEASGLEDATEAKI